MDNPKEKFQIVDEHWQMFEDLSDNESYQKLRTHADELGKQMKEAIINCLEVQKTMNDGKSR